MFKRHIIIGSRNYGNGIGIWEVIKTQMAKNRSKIHQGNLTHDHPISRLVVLWSNLFFQSFYLSFKIEYIFNFATLAYYGHFKSVLVFYVK